MATDVTVFSGAQGIVGGLFSMVLLVVYAVLAVGVILGIMWVLKNWVQYKIMVEVIEKVGDSEQTYFDKARISKKGGVPKLNIKKLGVNEPVPRSDLFTPVKKSGLMGGWGKLIRFYKNGEILTPLAPTKNSPVQLTPFIDSDVELWYALENQRAYETYNSKTFFEVYGPYMAFAGLFILIFIMGIIFFEQFGTIASAFQNAANQFAEAKAQEIAAG